MFAALLVALLSCVAAVDINIVFPASDSFVRLGTSGQFRVNFEVNGSVLIGTNYAIYLNDVYSGMFPLRSLKEQTFVSSSAGRTVLGVKLVDIEGEIIEGAEKDVEFTLLEPETIDEVRKRISDLRSFSEEKQAEFGRTRGVTEGVKDVNEDMDSFLKQDPDYPVDGSAYNSNRIDWMLLLSKDPSVKTVCETGFNFGMSARAFLQWPHIEKVYSFDLMDTAFKYRAQEYLQKKYGDRLEVFAGPTREQVPLFVQNHPDVRCDVVFIDGGHTGNDSEIDMLSLRQLSHADTIVIADDCSADGVGTANAAEDTREQIEAVWFAWQRMRSLRVIQNLGSARVCITALEENPDYNRCYPDHFLCFGRYLAISDTLRATLDSHLHSLLSS